MIKLPDFKKSFDYENNFYLSCDSSRLQKILVSYELFNMAKHLKGDIVECGVFKGTSLVRFAMLRKIFSTQKKIIAFDTFGKFPETNFLADKKSRKKFITDAGNQSISTNQLMKVLKYKNTQKNIKLIKGDINKTVPEYVKKHKDLKISLLNLDTDIYEPAVTTLENFYPKIVRGGVLILDDYGVFPGETKAVNDFFRNKNVKIKNFAFSKTPHYVIKQ